MKTDFRFLQGEACYHSKDWGVSLFILNDLCGVLWVLLCGVLLGPCGVLLVLCGVLLALCGPRTPLICLPVDLSVCLSVRLSICHTSGQRIIITTYSSRALSSFPYTHYILNSLNATEWPMKEHERPFFCYLVSNIFHNAIVFHRVEYK